MKKRKTQLAWLIPIFCTLTFLHQISVVRCSSNLVKLGDFFPNFDAETTIGKINFYDWLGPSWGILFSNPADYTPVGTTEFGRVEQLAPELKKRGVKLIALSSNDVESHNGWIKDILAFAHLKALSYPIIADENRELATTLGMLDPDEKDDKGIPLICRAVFIIGPDKKLKLSMFYPATTGRNFDEILRVVDSLQVTAIKKLATPVDWKSGEQCMLLPSVKPEEVARLFPYEVTVHDVPSGKTYLRTTTCRD